ETAMGTRNASSRWRYSECPSWPRRTGAIWSVTAAAVRRRARPRRGQGWGVPSAAATTASAPVTAHATHSGGTRRAVGGAGGRTGSSAAPAGSVRWAIRGFESEFSASRAGRAQLSPHESETQDDPAHDDPAHHDPAQDEPPHCEPPHCEPPHCEPPHEEPPHEEPPHEEPPHEEPPHEEPPHEEP